jgi:hypothetical protein
MAGMNTTPKRRWLAFSLRTLFVVMTIAAVLCFAAPLAVRKYEAWKRDRELRKLIRLIETTIVSSTSGPWDQPEGLPAAKLGQLPERDRAFLAR